MWPEIPRPVWPLFSRKNNPAAIALKYVDDLSIAAKVKLNSDIVSDTSRERPLTFDQRQERCSTPPTPCKL